MSYTVTVGLDGTREGMAAVDWAAREAHSRRVPLRLVQAHVAGAHLYSSILHDEGAQRRRAQQLTDRVAAQLAERCPELAVTREVLPGHPTRVLAEISTGQGLLVVGSRGLGSVLGFLAGSVALPTVARGRSPVVLVRAAPAGPAGEDGPGPAEPGTPGTPATPSAPDSAVEAPAGAAVADDVAVRPALEPDVEPPSGPVVLGTGMLHASDAALAFAFDAAARHARPLHVLHGLDLPPAYGVDTLPYTDGAVRDLERQRLLAMAGMLRPWRDRYPQVDVHHEAVAGRPSNVLVGASRGASLLVVGCRNRHARIGRHIGPITHMVSRRSRTPVAIVPHE